MCLYPKLIKNPKYRANKKNGGVIPPILDERVLYVPIGCQECLECKKKKAREWAVRLQEDIKTNTNGKFITLTFNDKKYKEVWEIIKAKNEKAEGYEMDNEIAKYAVRHWLENWRSKHGKSVRHWLVTELGHEGTENIHLHGIIWTNIALEEVESTWQYGYVWKGKMKNEKIENYVNEKTVNYIIKYVNKIDEKHKGYKSVILTSSGIGGSYTKRNEDSKKNKYKEEGGTIETYRTRQGIKLALPIYYRNKIYTEEEREKLWIEKLNKQERWILGNKVSIKEGEEKYNKALKYAQETNKELGYGDGEITWEQKEYEKARRNLKQMERINKAKQ